MLTKTRTMTTALACLCAFALACSDAEKPSTPEKIMFMAVPQEILPDGPDATPAEFEVFLDWLKRYDVATVPLKNCGDMQGPSLCREVYTGVSWCSNVCGGHHWMTSSGCYDAMTGASIRCW